MVRTSTKLGLIPMLTSQAERGQIMRPCYTPILHRSMFSCSIELTKHLITLDKSSVYSDIRTEFISQKFLL